MGEGASVDERGEPGGAGGRRERAAADEGRRRGGGAAAVESESGYVFGDLVHGD